MALRLMEIVLASELLASLRAALQGVQAHGTWEDAIGDDKSFVRVLIDSEHTEGLMDTLEQRFGGREDFRLMLLDVEATIPRIKPPEPEPETEPTTGPKQGQESAGAISEPLLGARISREELYEDLQAATRSTRVFAVMAVLSAVVAAIGLLRDSEAIVIGAMVIAPLLGPNISLAFATTLGDGEMAQRSIRVNLLGSSLVLGASLIIGVIVDPEPLAHAMAMRTDVGYGDILLAAAAGIAGVIAFTTGVAEALIGVMVAVALVPPLVAFGVLAGSGLWREAEGAGLLLATNVICVNLAAVMTFLAQGVRPRTWWEAAKAKRAARRAMLIWTALLVVLAGLIWLAREHG